MSSVVRGAKTFLPSGECASPSRAIFAAPRPCTATPSSHTSPRLGATRPEMARMVVVLPAPFAPMSATTVPLFTSSEVPARTSERP